MAIEIEKPSSEGKTLMEVFAEEDAAKEAEALKEASELRDIIKKADDDAIKQQAIDAINKQKAEREAKKAEEKKTAEPKKEYPHPTLKPGSILVREKQDEFLVVVNRDMLYKLCFYFISLAPPGRAIANMRQVGELMGVTDYAEAQKEWEKIRDEVHKRIKYA